MDEPSPLAGDELGDLSDDLRARIKSELAPDERLLWAARPQVRPLRITSGYVTAGLIAGVLCLTCLLSFGVAVGVFGFDFLESDVPGLVVLGVLTGLVGVLTAIGTISNWRNQYQQHLQASQRLYALTPRRAIIWMPSTTNKGAIEIHSFDLEQIQKIYRVEYSDGSGSVHFAPKETAASLDYMNNFEPVGFNHISKVRQMEDLLRRTVKNS